MRIVAYEFRQIFQLGFFHSDPHEGNIFVDELGRVTFIDWGQVGDMVTGLNPESFYDQRNALLMLMGGIFGTSPTLVAESLAIIDPKIDKEVIQSNLQQITRGFTKLHKEDPSVTLANEYMKYVTKTIASLNISNTLALFLKVMANIIPYFPKDFFAQTPNNSTVRVRALLQRANRLLPAVWDSLDARTVGHIGELALSDKLRLNTKTRPLSQFIIRNSIRTIWTTFKILGLPATQRIIDRWIHDVDRYSRLSAVRVRDCLSDASIVPQVYAQESEEGNGRKQCPLGFRPPNRTWEQTWRMLLESIRQIRSLGMRNAIGIFVERFFYGSIEETNGVPDETQSAEVRVNTVSASQISLNDAYHTTVVSQLPEEVRNETPLQFQDWVEEENPDIKILLLQDKEGVTYGFTSLRPDKDAGTWYITFKYIYPRYQGRGLGSKLQDAVYQWALVDPSVRSIHFGIEDVLSLSSDGTVQENLKRATTGTWTSYKSVMNGKLPDGTYPVVEVEFMKAYHGFMDPSTSIGLGFITTIRDTQGNPVSSRDPTLPLTGQELFDRLKTDHIPKSMSIAEMLDHADNNIQVYQNGREYTFYEFIRRQPEDEQPTQDVTEVTTEQSEQLTIFKEELDEVRGDQNTLPAGYSKAPTLPEEQRVIDAWRTWREPRVDLAENTTPGTVGWYKWQIRLLYEGMFQVRDFVTLGGLITHQLMSLEYFQMPYLSGVDFRDIEWGERIDRLIPGFNQKREKLFMGYQQVSKKQSPFGGGSPYINYVLGLHIQREGADMNSPLDRSVDWQMELVQYHETLLAMRNDPELAPLFAGQFLYQYQQLVAEQSEQNEPYIAFEAFRRGSDKIRQQNFERLKQLSFDRDFLSETLEK